MARLVRSFQLSDNLDPEDIAAAITGILQREGILHHLLHGEEDLDEDNENEGDYDDSEEEKEYNPRSSNDKFLKVESKTNSTSSNISKEEREACLTGVNRDCLESILKFLTSGELLTLSYTNKEFAGKIFSLPTDLSNINMYGNQIVKFFEKNPQALITGLKLISHGATNEYLITLCKKASKLSNLKLLLNDSEDSISALALLSNLQTLQLTFKFAPESDVFDCTSLTKLHFENCHIESFDNVTKLTKLRILELTDCHNFDFDCLKEVKNLPLLEEIEIFSANELVSLPSFRGCSKLKKLALHNCDRLANIAHLAKVTSLKELEVEYCERVSNIKWIKECKQLERLVLEMTHIFDISALAFCTNLKDVKLEQCHFSDITVLLNLSKLNKLEVTNCEELEYPEDMIFPALEELKFCPAPAFMKEVPIFRTNLINGIEANVLKELELIFNREDYETFDVSGLKYSPLLEVFHLSYRSCDRPGEEPTQLKKIVGYEVLKGFKFLKKFQVYSCEIDNVLFLDESPLLEDIAVTCSKIKSFNGIQNCKVMKSFMCYNNSEITNLDVFAHFPLLNHVYIRYCHNLKDVSGLRVASGLEYLMLEKCPLIEDLSFLESCTRIEVLNLEDNKKINNINCARGWPLLRNLKIKNCGNFSDLSPLTNCDKLYDVEIDNCTKVSSLEGLSNKKKLAFLKLTRCISLTDVTALKELTGLWRLKLTEIKSIDVSYLKENYKLKELDLSECYDIINPEALYGKHHLEIIFSEIGKEPKSVTPSWLQNRINELNKQREENGKKNKVRVVVSSSGKNRKKK